MNNIKNKEFTLASVVAIIASLGFIGMLIYFMLVYSPLAQAREKIVPSNYVVQEIQRNTPDYFNSKETGTMRIVWEDGLDCVANSNHIVCNYKQK